MANRHWIYIPATGGLRIFYSFYNSTLSQYELYMVTSSTSPQLIETTPTSDTGSLGGTYNNYVAKASAVSSSNYKLVTGFYDDTGSTDVVTFKLYSNATLLTTASVTEAEVGAPAPFSRLFVADGQGTFVGNNTIVNATAQKPTVSGFGANLESFGLLGQIALTTDNYIDSEPNFSGDIAMGSSAGQWTATFASTSGSWTGTSGTPGSISGSGGGTLNFPYIDDNGIFTDPITYSFSGTVQDYSGGSLDVEMNYYWDHTQSGTITVVPLTGLTKSWSSSWTLTAEGPAPGYINEYSGSATLWSSLYISANSSVSLYNKRVGSASQVDRFRSTSATDTVYYNDGTTEYELTNTIASLNNTLLDFGANYLTLVGSDYYRVEPFLNYSAQEAFIRKYSQTLIDNGGGSYTLSFATEDFTASFQEIPFAHRISPGYRVQSVVYHP